MLPATTLHHLPIAYMFPHYSRENGELNSGSSSHSAKRSQAALKQWILQTNLLKHILRLLWKMGESLAG
jgi:hypothetical protein